MVTPTEAPPSILTDEDLRGIEASLLKRTRNAAFFPADANYLADVVMELIREVRTHRVTKLVLDSENKPINTGQLGENGKCRHGGGRQGARCVTHCGNGMCTGPVEPEC